MAKIILAVSTSGALSVAAHVPGRGFVMIGATSQQAAKFAVKYGDTSYDNTSIRRRMNELSLEGWSNVRVDDLSRLPIKEVHSVGIDSSGLSLCLRSEAGLYIQKNDDEPVKIAGWAE